MIGPNGPPPRDPDAPYIKRHREVDAWDNEDFRIAVRATGTTQIIIAGITTDVSIANIRVAALLTRSFTSRCAAFLAHSIIEEGYTVYANADASGALSERISSDANDRMRAAEVHVLSSFADVCDLMREEHSWLLRIVALL
jgi:nicotinamidase-related amidase